MAAATSEAAAQEIVLESYGGARPADAAALLQPVLTELQSRGYLVGNDLEGRIARSYGRSGDGLEADAVTQAQRFVDSGYEQFLNGNWELAIDETRRGIDILRGAPAHMARHQELRDSLFAGLVHMAGAYHRLGEGEEATRTMAELLRTFPEKEISRARYAPNFWELWRQVREDLRQRGLGRLEVSVDDRRTIIFVDERYIGLGSVTVDDVYPGIHRVYLQQGERGGRVHEVDVDAGGEGSLSINWALDSALTTGDGYVGLEHESDPARASHEARLAAKLAATVGSDGVIVLGIRNVNGRRSIVGTVLSVATSKPIRSTAVAVEPVEPAPEKIRALALFLAGEDVNDSVVQRLTQSQAPDRQNWYADPLGWGLTGTGVAVSGVGLGLMLNARSLERDANTEPDAVRRQILREQAGSR